MNISGYVYKENEGKIMEEYKQRFEKIKHHVETIDLKTTPSYGKGVFRGTLKTDEEKQLSELDLCLIADKGNLCFGGYCTIRGDTFEGAYYTD